MKKLTRLVNMLIPPAAACAAIAVLATWTLNAPAADPEDRQSLAGKSYRGAEPTTPQIPKAMADNPHPAKSTTITPNTPQWNLPLARPGAEKPAGDAPRLTAIRMRATSIGSEGLAGTYATGPYPRLGATTPLAWSAEPASNELSVPATMSGPDAAMSNDPTAIQSRNAVLIGRPILRTAPAEFRRLNIPDPFGLVEPIKLGASGMPADTDPPTTPPTPADPTMPVARRR
jgi:hypothetical protein